MSRPVSTGVQVLSILLYAGFAISTSIVALDAFWPAGVPLAAFYALQWARIPLLSGAPGRGRQPGGAAPQATPSDSTAFESYRSEMLARLETEKARFDGFVSRLRASKDAAEFEAFMRSRAASAKTPRAGQQTGPETGPQTRRDTGKVPHPGTRTGTDDRAAIRSDDPDRPVPRIPELRRPAAS